MSKISIALAAYNGELYLEEQLNSILPQLGSNDEIIISYDISTDKTFSILMRYADKDSRVKVYVNEEQPGLFGNFQNALSKCTGDIIFISDQDDIWEENKISKVVNIICNSQYDMVIHNGVHIDREGNVISDSFFTMYNIGNNKIRNFVMPRYSGCCTAFKKELLKKILPIPTKVGAYDHWVGSIGEYFGKVYFLEDILIRHRIHGENVTPKNHRSLRIIIKARWNLAINLLKRIMV